MRLIAHTGDFVPSRQEIFGTKRRPVGLLGLRQAVKFRLPLGLNSPPIVLNAEDQSTDFRGFSRRRR
jgi:hypothetical protein